MRTRITQNPASLPYNLTIYDDRAGNLTYGGTPGSYQFYDLEAQIEDETPNYRRTGSVNHVKITTNLTNHDPYVYNAGDAAPGAEPPFKRWIPGSNWVARYHYAVCPRPTLADHLQYGAIRSPSEVASLAGFSWPNVDIAAKIIDLERSETKVDLLVNIVEASQLRSLVREAPRLARALIANLHKTSRALRDAESWGSFSRAILKSGWRASKDASSSLLGYSFGIRPLLSDIMALRNELINAEENIRRTKARANRVHTWRDRTVSNQTASNLAGWGSYPQYWASQRTWPLQPTTVTSVRYIDDLLFPDSALADLGIMARRLGVVPRFEAALELVPFSFVADWAFGIGAIAELLDNRVSFLRKRRILEASLSRCFEYKRDYFWSPPPSINHPTGKVGESVVRYYHRSVLNPTWDSIPDGSGLGKMRGLLLAALLRQRNWRKIASSAARSSSRMKRFEPAVRRLAANSPRRRVYHDLQQAYALLERR